jgi:hypothetical protein
MASKSGTGSFFLPRRFGVGWSCSPPDLESPLGGLLASLVEGAEVGLNRDTARLSMAGGTVAAFCRKTDSCQCGNSQGGVAGRESAQEPMQSRKDACFCA